MLMICENRINQTGGKGKDTVAKYMKKLGIDTIYGFEDRCMYWYPKGGFDPDYIEDKE